MQEQSQRPSFPISQVQTSVFPHARTLDSLVNHHDSCAETVFYMTWGRKNGDASNCAFFPPLCTYQGMDSLLNLRYRMMADSNDAIVSPVGAVWNYIRVNYPSIELYSADESHPSVAGTYAAACSFYSTFFRKDPSLVPFNSSLSALEAQTIRNAAKVVVYDSLAKWHVGEYDPVASFAAHGIGFTPCIINLINNSKNATSFYWDFGDGDSSTQINPTHTFPNGSWYTVTLIASKCGLYDTAMLVVLDPCLRWNNIESHKLTWSIFPNPAVNTLKFETNEWIENRFSIYNSLGAEVAGGNITSEKNHIDISELPTGIYFLHLMEKGKSLGYRKFVKAN